MKAVWNGEVLADSDDTILVESNHYFPAESLNTEFFKPSSSTSTCFWKGKANYYDIVVKGQRNDAAAWYYANPTPKAAQIKGRVAFWKGVKILP